MFVVEKNNRPKKNRKQKNANRIIEIVDEKTIMYIYRKRGPTENDKFGCCLKKEHFDGLLQTVNGNS
jgi:hypothetical protein